MNGCGACNQVDFDQCNFPRLATYASILRYCAEPYGEDFVRGSTTNMSAADDLCTGAQTEKPGTELSRVMEYADNIVKYWKKSADISAVASLCSGANKELSPAEKKEFYSKLPFDRTVFSKVARIGSDLRLHHEEIDKLLPANYSMQCEITKLADYAMKAAIDQGVIHSRAK